MDAQRNTGRDVVTMPDVAAALVAMGQEPLMPPGQHHVVTILRGPIALVYAQWRLRDHREGQLLRLHQRFSVPVVRLVGGTFLRWFDRSNEQHGRGHWHDDGYGNFAHRAELWVTYGDLSDRLAELLLCAHEREVVWMQRRMAEELRCGDDLLFGELARPL